MAWPLCACRYSFREGARYRVSVTTSTKPGSTYAGLLVAITDTDTSTAGSSGYRKELRVPIKGVAPGAGKTAALETEMDAAAVVGKSGRIKIMLTSLTHWPSNSDAVSTTVDDVSLSEVRTMCYIPKNTRPMCMFEPQTVVFALDSSGTAQYQLAIIQFAERMLRRMNVASNRIRVAGIV